MTVFRVKYRDGIGQFLEVEAVASNLIDALDLLDRCLEKPVFVLDVQSFPTKLELVK